MHTYSVLQKFLTSSLPDMHKRRREAVAVAVDAVLQGAAVNITAMGRGLGSASRIKHRVKRMDRLVGNRLLNSEREWLYRAMIQRVLSHCSQPVILVDWSDFSVDRQQQLLRATLPAGGRSITLYEELHPYKKLGNRQVQQRFLDHLNALLPKRCTPIIVADAGFRVPFSRYVAALGWHWVGRIRNRDYVLWDGAPQDWIPAKSLYRLATPRAQDLGQVGWVRRAPLVGRLILIRHPKHGRKDRTLAGPSRRSRRSRKHARQVREPWLLVAAPALANLTPRQIMRIYKTRMQIEENFRDTKSSTYGLGIARCRHTSLMRATNLLLLAAIATFLLWLIGCFAKAAGWDQRVRVNSSSRQADYSTLYLARLAIQHLRQPLPRTCLGLAGKLVPIYLQTVLNA